MSQATKPVTVGSILTSMEELDALPHLAVVLGDPDCKNPREADRCIALQKRASDSSSEWWYPAWDTDIWNALASTEVVHRFGLGPFVVLWLPQADGVAVDAAA